MAIFGDIRDLISSFITPRKAAPVPSRPNVPTASLRLEGVRHSLPRDARKRKAPPAEPDTNKRNKLGNTSQLHEAGATSPRNSPPGGPVSDDPSPDQKRHGRAKRTADRALMPPPAIRPISVSKTSSTAPQARRRSPESAEEAHDDTDEQWDDDDRDGRPRPLFPSDHEDIQQRYEEAMALPENSGIWSEVEKDLFYRLALRGVEPLLPNSWMKDFPTFPLSCFAYQHGSTPLIVPQKAGDFRAIRALRELVDMGQRVRDRALATQRLQPEPVISKYVNRYISWALADVGVHPDQLPDAIPTHAMVAMQPGQATQDVITEITSKLHKLSAKHRAAQNIRTSVESRERTPLSNGETQVIEDDGELPILTGLMICASLVIIVTLSCHDTPRDTSETPALTPKTRESRASSGEARESSGLRFIATFDFSESGHDVWNALAIAITAIYIRKSMVVMHERALATGNLKLQTTKPAGKKAKKAPVDDPDL